MHYVYILRSESNSEQLYFGKTKDLKLRLQDHNSGKSKHTSKYMPWKVIWFGCFESSVIATAFENYLKTASGKAFLRKRLIKY